MFYLLVAGLVVFFAVVLAAFIGILILFGHMAGRAFAGPDLESADPKVRLRALSKFFFAVAVLMVLCRLLMFIVSRVMSRF